MNVAIFLDDVNEFNGPLMFIPGSHKKGVVDAKHDLTTTSYPLWTVDNDTDRPARGARRRQERRHRLAQGPGRLDDPVPLLPGARVGQQPVAVEPRQRVPEPVRGQQPHPPLQAPRVHRAPRLHADRLPARRLPAEGLPGRPAVEGRHAAQRAAPPRPSPSTRSERRLDDEPVRQTPAARRRRPADAHRPDRRRQVRLDVPGADAAHARRAPGRHRRPVARRARAPTSRAWAGTPSARRPRRWTTR